MQSKGLLITRILGTVAALAGLIGFVGIYSWFLTFEPIYQPGLLWCGVLASGGVALVVGSTTRAGSWAGFVRPAALAVVVTALGASVWTGVAVHLWVRAVVRFS